MSTETKKKILERNENDVPMEVLQSLYALEDILSNLTSTLSMYRQQST